MWLGNQDLQIQEREDCIKSKKARILAIIMFVPKNNPPGYKEHVIYFITFSFVEGVTIAFIV